MQTMKKNSSKSQFLQHANHISTASILQLPVFGKLTGEQKVTWERFKNNYKQPITSNNNVFSYHCSLLDLSYQIRAIVGTHNSVQIVYGVVELDPTHRFVIDSVNKFWAYLVLKGNQTQLIKINISENLEIVGLFTYKIDCELLSQISLNFEKHSIVIHGISQYPSFSNQNIFDLSQSTQIRLKHQQDFNRCLYHINRIKIKSVEVSLKLKSKPSIETDTHITFPELSHKKNLSFLNLPKIVAMKSSQTLPRECDEMMMQTSLSLKEDSFANYFAEFDNTLFQEQKNPETLCLFNSFEQIDESRNKQKELKMIEEIKRVKKGREDQIKQLKITIDHQSHQKEKLQELNIALKKDIKRIQKINTFTDFAYIQNLKNQIQSLCLHQNQLINQLSIINQSQSIQKSKESTKFSQKNLFKGYCSPEKQFKQKKNFNKYEFRVHNKSSSTHEVMEVQNKKGSRPQKTMERQFSFRTQKIVFQVKNISNKSQIIRKDPRSQFQ